MRQTLSFRSVVAASVLASALTIAGVWGVYAFVISPESAFAQAPNSPDVVLYAGPRGDSGRETFIFYSEKTGDIWVYRDEKFKVRYRLTQLGADLEKLD